MLKKLPYPLAKLHSLASRALIYAPRKGFIGAFPSHKAAMDAVPRRALAGYGHTEIAPVAMTDMQQIKEWDYPVLFWLDRFLRQAGGDRISLVDAGGHTGTKYIAFQTRIDLSKIDWMIYDLPEVIELGRQVAEDKGLPITLTSEISDLGTPDILLCSGLLQYLDISLSEFLAKFENKPEKIILNKVQLRDGDTVFTYDRIGPAYVPYAMRNRQGFLAEIERLGYAIIDSWKISALAHKIATHPELGQSESWGFVLELNSSVASFSEV